MRVRSCLIPLTAIAAIAFAADASAEAMVRQQKVISSAGARAMVEACTAWAELNHETLAMSVLDCAGNQLESHAMEGAAANAIDGEKCAQAAIDAVFKKPGAAATP
jgi:NADH dehydrogenase/NADH:ubiquinone oxidoreductase subunit G